MSTVLDNLWRFPNLAFAVLIIAFGMAKQKLYPRVAQRVIITGVVELAVSLLSWVAWESFIRNGYDNGRWAFALTNAGLSVMGLAGYATLLTAVFLDRAPTHSQTQSFYPGFTNPQVTDPRMMHPPTMDQPPVPPPWPFQPPQ